MNYKSNIDRTFLIIEKTIEDMKVPIKYTKGQEDLKPFISGNGTKDEPRKYYWKLIFEDTGMDKLPTVNAYKEILHRKENDVTLCVNLTDNEVEICIDKLSIKYFLTEFSDQPFSIFLDLILKAFEGVCKIKKYDEIQQNKV